MNKIAIRYLGIGIFLTGAVFTINSNYLSAPETSEKNWEAAYHTSQQELQDVKEQLAELQLNLNQSNESNETTKTEASPVRTTILSIKPGMTPFDVSTLLEDTQIIDSRTELEGYLVETGLSSRLQVGTYEISSDMSIQQIAETITKK